MWIVQGDEFRAGIRMLMVQVGLGRARKSGDLLLNSVVVFCPVWILSILEFEVVWHCLEFKSWGGLAFKFHRLLMRLGVVCWKSETSSSRVSLQGFHTGFIFDWFSLCCAAMQQERVLSTGMEKLKMCQLDAFLSYSILWYVLSFLHDYEYRQFSCIQVNFEVDLSVFLWRMALIWCTVYFWMLGLVVSLRHLKLRSRKTWKSCMFISSG